ncbi:hypothetical protein RRG08_005915, partial [Elysia crispata]
SPESPDEQTVRADTLTNTLVDQTRTAHPLILDRPSSVISRLQSTRITACHARRGRERYDPILYPWRTEEVVGNHYSIMVQLSAPAVDSSYSYYHSLPSGEQGSFRETAAQLGYSYLLVVDNSYSYYHSLPLGELRKV